VSIKIAALNLAQVQIQVSIHGVLMNVQADSTLAVIKEIASRLKHLDRVEKISADSWQPLSLCAGWPALLLTFATLDRIFPDEGWDRAGHECVIRIKEEIEQSGITDFSLFDGLAGICFAVLQASRKKTRYVRLLSSLEQYLIEEIKRKILRVKKKLKDSAPLRMEEFDLISGFTGMGIYLLQNLDSPISVDLLQEICECAVKLSDDRMVEGKVVPGWHIPAEYQFLPEEKIEYPKGNFNLGLAHGISGVLAFLSTLALRGVTGVGHREAIEKMARWLQSKKRGDYWPTRVSLEEEIGGDIKEPFPSERDSWCYGAPGIARALFLAGNALKESSLIEFAESSMHAVFTRNWQLSSPTFCHGFSGLLMTANSMKNEISSPLLSIGMREAKEQLFAFYNGEYPFGFKDVESKGAVDKIGILDGCTGVLLTLLATECGESSWAEPFLV
jgi:lantibiotic modifying enzyme